MRVCVSSQQRQVPLVDRLSLRVAPRGARRRRVGQAPPRVGHERTELARACARGCVALRCAYVDSVAYVVSDAETQSLACTRMIRWCIAAKKMLLLAIALLYRCVCFYKTLDFCISNASITYRCARHKPQVREGAKSSDSTKSNEKGERQAKCVALRRYVDNHTGGLFVWQQHQSNTGRF